MTDRTPSVHDRVARELTSTADPGLPEIVVENPRRAGDEPLVGSVSFRRRR